MTKDNGNAIRDVLAFNGRRALIIIGPSHQT